LVEIARFDELLNSLLSIDTLIRPTLTRLSIKGQLDIGAAGALEEALLRAADAGGSVELDLGGVDFIDGSGLSVLMEADSRARHMSRELRIVNPSRNVRRLIEFTDTADLLSPLSPVAGALRAPATNG
jgi:anti-sigma B factor antagonist